MIAAGKISRLAVGDAAIRPAVQTYTVPQTLLQHDRMSEELPFGTRGGAGRPTLLPGRRRVRDQRPAAANARQPDSRPGRAERHRAAARPAARQVTSRVGGDGPRDPWSAVPSASPYEQTADEKLDRAAGDHGRPARSQRGVSREERSPEGAREPGCRLRPTNTPATATQRWASRRSRSAVRSARGRPATRRAAAGSSCCRPSGRRRGRVRDDDPQDARAPRVSPAGRRDADRRPALHASFYRRQRRARRPAMGRLRV